METQITIRIAVKDSYFYKGNSCRLLLLQRLMLDIIIHIGISVGDSNSYRNICSDYNSNSNSCSINRFLSPQEQLQKSCILIGKCTTNIYCYSYKCRYHMCLCFQTPIPIEINVLKIIPLKTDLLDLLANMKMQLEQTTYAN